MTLNCNQVGCSEPGVYRFTWPGKDEQHICAKHVGKLKAVAEAIGLPLQVIPIDATGARAKGVLDREQAIKAALKALKDADALIAESQPPTPERGEG